jgi:uncharacterized protein
VQDFQVSVAEILGRPGTYRDVHLDGALEGIETPLAKVDQGISGEVRLESVVEGVLATGTVEAGATFVCARCLKEMPAGMTVDLTELFYGPGHGEGEDDAYRVTGMEVDLEPALRDAVTLALPLNPVCKEDCKGICARCGKDLNFEGCVCGIDEVDPRWAALDALRERLAQ